MVDYPDWNGPSSNVFTQIRDYTAVPFPGVLDTDVSNYTSVVVGVTSNDGVTPGSATYGLYNPPFVMPVDYGLLSANTTNGTIGGPQWHLPVVAPLLRLTNPVNNGVAVRIFGTMAPLTKKLATQVYPSRLFRGTIAANAPANTSTPMIEVDSGIVGETVDRACSAFNGAVTFIPSMSAAVVGLLTYAQVHSDMTVANRTLFTNPGVAPAPVTMGHPFGWVQWFYTNTAVAPATPTTVNLLMIAASPNNS